MNLPEKWIWLSSEIYPDFQNTNVSAMTGKPDCNYCVAEFKKEIFLRSSGDAAQGTS